MLKLILADNQAIFRAGIAKVLAVEDEMRIVAQAQTPEQMMMALDKFRAAVIIVAGGAHAGFNSLVPAAGRGVLEPRIAPRKPANEIPRERDGPVAEHGAYRTRGNVAMGQFRRGEA